MQSDVTRLMKTIPGITLEGDEAYIKVFMEMNTAPPSLEDYGVELLSRADNVYVARLPVANLKAVASLPEVVRMEGDAWVKPMLNLSVPEIGADRVWRELGDETGGRLRGNGVVAGMVDSGIYSGHRNFTEEGSGDSRILYVWDLGDGTGPAPEETCRDYTWDPPKTIDCGGTECSPRDEGCDVEDEAGHGTWVMGVMAGNGRAKHRDCGKGCIGVAPQADIIVVGLGEGLASEVIQGVDYIFQKASAMGKPAVVNLSVGWYAGSRDGNSLLERHLSGLLRDSEGSLVPGRIIVAAAGNEALEMGHAQADVSSGEKRRTLVIDCNPSLSDEARVYGWYDEPSAGGEIEVRVVKFNVTTPWVGLDQEVERDSTMGKITIQHSERSGNARGFTIILESGASRLQEGNWRIELRGHGLEGAVNVDMWVERTLLVGSASNCQKPVRFTKADAVAASTIAPACTADDVICVASYNTRCLSGTCTGCSLDYGLINCMPGAEGVDDLSSFSSLGPRRDGGKEPTLAAPGQVILTPGPEGEADYWYVGGTSFSAPHVAGTVALMLQANPSLTVTDVRNALESSACDPQVEDECVPVNDWNDAWGWGKHDAFGAVTQVASPIPPPEPFGLGDGDDTCFIATAVFGDVDAPQVENLRAFRDKFLLRTSLGRGFVRSYYRWSPPVAAWLKEHAMLSRMARLSLMPLVGISEMVCHRSSVRGLASYVFGLFLLSAVCYSSLKRRIR
jgi:subtilisin family serine protease